MVPDPFASREDLLKMLLIDFGVLSIQELTSGRLRQASRTELGYLLSEFLDSLTPDAFVVVIIDEAQNLSLPLIEEIAHSVRHLRRRGPAANRVRRPARAARQVEAAGNAAGRPAGVRLPSPRAPGREAVEGYIQHRLQVAGGRRDRVLFSPAIIDDLHLRSGGVPRLINRVCDRALQLAYERQCRGRGPGDSRDRADRDRFRDDVADVGFDHLR